MTPLQIELHSVFSAAQTDAFVAATLWAAKRAKATYVVNAGGEEYLYGDSALSEDEAYAATDAYAADKVKAPYGDVHYCDDNMRGDGKKRFPVDTKERAKAAWSYSHHKSIMDKYTAEQLTRLHACIARAYKHFFGEEPQSS